MAEVFTQAGEEWLADIVNDLVQPPTDYYIAWGTGGTAPAKGDTTLETEGSESRVVATESQPAADQNRFVGQITADGSKTIQEAGLLTASTGGTLIVRGTHTGVAVTSGDKIEYTITITWS